MACESILMYITGREASRATLQEHNAGLWHVETLDVPSVEATALIVAGSSTSTTTFYVNFSVISARTGGSRWVLICWLPPAA